jgi:hypothetical protein
MLTGTLDDLALRPVLRFIASSHKTGKLAVSGPAAGGRIYFRSGDVYHAESDVLREGFGRKLVRSGKLGEGVLRHTLNVCAATGKGLGEALVEGGHISRRDLEEALREEIEEVVHGLLRNDSGDFSFETDEQVDADTVTLVRVESLLRDDRAVLEERVPYLNPAFVRASISTDEAFEISITSEEWSVIAMIDGRRTLGEVSAALGLDGHSVMRVLRRLLTVGLVSLSDDGGSPPPVSVRAARPARPLGAPPPPPPPPPVVDLREDAPAWARERP